jgi:hypothetical protein
MATDGCHLAESQICHAYTFREFPGRAIRNHRLASRINILWWSSITVAKILFQSGFRNPVTQVSKSATESPCHRPPPSATRLLYVRYFSHRVGVARHVAVWIVVVRDGEGVAHAAPTAK